MDKAQQSQENIQHKGIWKRFVKTLRVVKVPWLWLLVYLVLCVGSNFIILMFPYVRGDLNSGNVSVIVITTIIVMEILSGVVGQSTIFMRQVVGGRIDRNFRNVLWEKILKLRSDFFDRVSSNTLISRITDDIESLKEFLVDVVIAELLDIATLVTTITLMATMDLRLGIIMLIYVPLVLLMAFFMGRIETRVYSNIKLKMASLTDYLSGQIAKVIVIKSFNRQAHETQRGEKAIQDYYIAEKKSFILQLIYSMISTVVGLVPNIGMIILGIKLLSDGVMDVKEWVVFNTYASNIINYFARKSVIWSDIKTVQGRLYRVSHILEEPEEGVAPYVHEIVESGDLMFDEVSFSYDETPVLEQASFTVKKHQMTAVVGPSGTGKSTVLKLMCRIYEPKHGRILLHGDHLSEYKLSAWRKDVSYVAQEPPLISGTIRDNILYGNDASITDEEIMKAAEQLAVDEFISTCESGLDYQVGQFGERMSGGQRQKLSILRAYLQKREYMLLDEPTANLDRVAVYEVLQTIERLKGTRTVVIATHDVDLLDYVDHVVVLEKDHSSLEGSVADMVNYSDYYRVMVAEARGKNA